jgi:hypothetical protein
VGVLGGRPLDRCRGALYREEHCHHGVCYAVVEHVPFPLELDFSVCAVAHGHAAHDEVGSNQVGDLLVSFLRRCVVVPIGIPVGVAVLCGAAHFRKLFNGAKRSLESPLDQIDASGAERQPLAAGNGRGVESCVLAQVLGSHQGQLEVVLD